MGGGLKDMQLRDLRTERGRMLIVHLFVDVKDAMGANAVNAYCEDVAPFLEILTGGKAGLRILSNLATSRMASATATWRKETVGADVIDRILDAQAFAAADPYRAATHNKGIMNAIDSMLIATCNDWRAVEAGAHAYAALNGYKPLTQYERNKHGDLVGRIELPMAVGMVGGATKMHPVAQVSLKILKAKSACELAEIAACVGLACNFAAMRAMVTEGIRKGHMKLHATNIAHMAGAKEDDINAVAQRMIDEGNVSFSRARQLIKDVRRIRRKKEIRKLIHRVHERVHKHETRKGRKRRIRKKRK
jgi:hydroxymethylglutaryl-CoA reductase